MRDNRHVAVMEIMIRCKERLFPKKMVNIGVTRSGCGISALGAVSVYKMIE